MRKKRVEREDSKAFLFEAGRDSHRSVDFMLLLLI